MKKTINFIWIICILSITIYSCTNNKSQKFIGNWVNVFKADKQYYSESDVNLYRYRSLEIKKVGEHFRIKIFVNIIYSKGGNRFIDENTETKEVFASYDKENDKLLLSNDDGGEIIYDPEKKVIIFRNIEYKK